MNQTQWPYFRHDRAGESTMRTARSTGRGPAVTIAPHATGHRWAKDRTLLRVDYEGGIGWVATRYDPDLRVIELVRGSHEEVLSVAACWALEQEKP
jgi:hypothetical protein